RKMPPPALELPHDLKIDYKSLYAILHARGSLDKHIGAVRRAYAFAARVHEGEWRKGAVKGKKEPYITHALNVAIRVARKGGSEAAVCAALLHDTIEDTHKPGTTRSIGPLTPEAIEEIFEGAPIAPAFAKRVAELVVRLTKPKFSEEKEWVFADDGRYYQIKDLDDDSLYDQRSDAYYEKLQDSGDMEALLIKFCDNLHNAETMYGITDAQRQKNFRTMANKSLGIARLIFTKEEFDYVASQFELWRFRLPPTVEKAPPSDILVFFPPRSQIRHETLYSHPDPSAAYISIYGSAYDAFRTGEIEIGLPPDLAVNYRVELEKRLPHGLFCEQAKSMVPKSFPMHEVIFRITGFNKKDEASTADGEGSTEQLSLPAIGLSQGRHSHGKTPQRAIRPSPNEKGFTDILDEKGEVVVSISDSAFSPRHILFGERLQREFHFADARYAALQNSLRELFSEVLVPALERSQSVAPPSPSGSEIL
ncbi:MAG: HD domain-containing protein, partial [Candidatus Bilamarchaeaceae archaeon]